ncbi:MAG TPA: ATP-binding protein, partial [Pyrinomonadaceae bacterium]
LAIVCIAPLLTIAATSFIISRNSARAMLREELDREVGAATNDFDNLVRDRQSELQQLAAGRPMAEFTRVPYPTQEPSQDFKDAVSRSVRTNDAFSNIAMFRADKQLMLMAEASSSGVMFRATGFTENDSEPDQKSWNAKSGETVCALAARPAVGRTLRCATPVANQTGDRFLLVGDINLSSLLMNVARERNGDPKPEMFVVLDRSGQIVYHTNDALNHQQVQNAFPEFAPVAAVMSAGQIGVQTYRATNGDEWMVSYKQLPYELSAAVMHNSSQALTGVRRSGWLIAGFAVLLGMGMATTLVLLYQRRLAKIERVTEGVNAIAKGDLERFIEARSRDDIRPLADGVNLMTEQLRRQLAREAETRQFQNFVRLSAMLTHDLKNVIGSLSLLVSNIEEHFDNPEFRADAMRALTETAEKMQALVERLSNPVTTLSGEFKQPEAVDLVPVIKRVLGAARQAQRDDIKVETVLPPSLIARVDPERMEKVIENLIINALEAMAGTGGTLLVQAGKNDADRVWFKVSDSGVGMSPRFIEEKLFHAFATTKKKGMGLGLYTCREVVQAHGGTIEVQSKQGAGTTFSIVLPSPSSSRNVSTAERKSSTPS